MLRDKKSKLTDVESKSTAYPDIDVGISPSEQSPDEEGEESGLNADVDGGVDRKQTVALTKSQQRWLSRGQRIGVTLLKLKNRLLGRN